jgi:hypothetical protein
MFQDVFMTWNAILFIPACTRFTDVNKNALNNSHSYLLNNYTFV